MMKTMDMAEGEWKNDEKYGHGIYYYSNGDIYEGEWKNDLEERYGIKYFSNGDRYEGYFKEGKYNGFDYFILP